MVHVSKIRRSELCCIFFISLVLAVYAYFICKNAALEFGDDYQFLKFLDKGDIVYGWCARYRFWPLGLFDYNILHFVPRFRTVLCMYVWNVLIMVSFINVIYIYFKKIVQEKYGKDQDFLYATVGCVCLLFSSIFVDLHFHLIYPERFIIFALSVFMLAQHVGYKKQSTAAYIVAFISAVYCTYCKETMFVIFAVIAGFNLCCKYDILKNKMPVICQFSKKDIVFNYCLLGNCAVYLILYFIITAHHVNPYTRAYINSDFNFILCKFLNSSAIYFTIGFFVVYRVFSLFKSKSYNYTITDSYMLSGVVYILALLVLGLKFDYYFSVPMLCMLPSILLAFADIIKTKSQFYKMLAFVIFSAPNIVFITSAHINIESVAISKKLMSAMFPQLYKSIVENGGRLYCYLSDIDKLDKNKHAIKSLLSTEYGCLLRFLGDSRKCDYVNDSIDCIDAMTVNDIALFYPNDRETIKTVCRKLLAKGFSLMYHALIGIYGHKHIEMARSDFSWDISSFNDEPKSLAHVNISNGILKKNICFIKLKLCKESNYSVKFNFLNCKNSRVSVNVHSNKVFDHFSKVDKVELVVDIKNCDMNENGEVIFEIEAWPDEKSKEIMIEKVDVKKKTD